MGFSSFFRRPERVEDSMQRQVDLSKALMRKLLEVDQIAQETNNPRLDMLAREMAAQVRDLAFNAYATGKSVVERRAA